MTTEFNVALLKILVELDDLAWLSVLVDLNVLVDQGTDDPLTGLTVLAIPNSVAMFIRIRISIVEFGSDLKSERNPMQLN